MSRVSRADALKLQELINRLPTEVWVKCSLCNDTLTHLTKSAESETGLGTATVCNAIAFKVNEDAKPMDKVSGEALRQRVLDHSGEKNRKCSNGTNKTKPDLYEIYRKQFEKLFQALNRLKAENFPGTSQEAVGVDLLKLVEAVY